MTHLIVLAFIGYLVAGFLLLTKQKRFGFVVFLIAAHLCVIHVAKDWRETGQPPLGSMYHVLVFLGASALPSYAAIVLGRKLKWMAPVIVLCGAAPLALTLMPIHSFQRDAAWHLAPALQSPWFIPHVMAYMVSYLLCFIAAVIHATAFLFSEEGSENNTRLVSSAHEVLTLAFPLLTFGMLSGALWANSIWGRYWSWDQKEVWAAITWTMYLVYFHCRKGGKMRRFTGLAHAMAFLALLTTFFLVNILPKLASKLHSYV